MENLFKMFHVDLVLGGGALYITENGLNHHISKNGKSLT